MLCLSRAGNMGQLRTGQEANLKRLWICIDWYASSNCIALAEALEAA